MKQLRAKATRGWMLLEELQKLMEILNPTSQLALPLKLRRPGGGVGFAWQADSDN